MLLLGYIIFFLNMANQFNSYAVNAPKKNRFRGLSHSVKFSANMGNAIPLLVQDVIPNDTFKISVSSLVRFAPLIAPILSEVDVYFHAFFVPDRIIWTKAEDFYTGAHNGVQLAPEDVPQKPRLYFKGAAVQSLFDNKYFTTSSLADYLGFQPIVDADEIQGDNAAVDLDAMPFRAYLRIWYDYYRDENLSYDNMVSGSAYGDTLQSIWDSSGYENYSNASFANTTIPILMKLRRRAWKKDYFTSALPFSQKGSDVLIPSSIGGSSALQRKSSTLGDFVTSITSGTQIPASSNIVSPSYSMGSGAFSPRFESYPTASIGLNHSNLVINGDGLVNEGTIRDLRRAMAAQRFLERRAVGGSRYQEQNLAMFGIKGSDARLQRAEYLGGIKNPVVVSQLLQTSETTSSSPQGTPSGNAVSAGSGFLFKRTFEEYGWIMVIMSVIPKADYMQGTPRMYLRKDVYDYYWPQFARIGEQPIYNAELYTEYESGSYNDDGNNYGTFGYTPRYAEYRFRNNRVCGDFKNTLAPWTLARSFSGIPSLTGTFVECYPSNRIFAVSSSSIDHLWCEAYFNIDAIRPVVKYAENL